MTTTPALSAVPAASSMLVPDYVFEASWEVCNKVGGIYTVLSSRAKTLTAQFGDRLLFLGPDVWGRQPCPYFAEDPTLLADWVAAAAKEGLHVRVGRWTVPGSPVALLVDFFPFFSQKNSIYAHMWEDYHVDSLHAYGDYDEASMFAYGAARVAEHYYHYFLSASGKRVVFHANEWMTGLAALYINRYVPEIGTVFTTHATSIGRSICGNRKPLYSHLAAYDGDQMAAELNMQSKHSVEKQTAHHCDCFTTVSSITAEECRVLLQKVPAVILPNGFDDTIVPVRREYNRRRQSARRALLHLAHCLTGKTFDKNTLLVGTSGRYEFHNKGLDLFLAALSRLRSAGPLAKEVVAFVLVPGWVKEPRHDLRARLLAGGPYHEPLQYPQLTHWLHNLSGDAVMTSCQWLDMWNKPSEQVNIIFVPCYLTGDDGILNRDYYDVLLALDLCVFPSYYEPWGYTPLEAIAFHVPCVTTDLAGFGRWVDDTLGYRGTIQDGVAVVHRRDDNFDAVANEIRDIIAAYAQYPVATVRGIRHKASALARQARWEQFVEHYYAAYHCALTAAAARSAHHS